MAGEDNVKHIEDCSVAKFSWVQELQFLFTVWAGGYSKGKLMLKLPGLCKYSPVLALGTWVFSVAGALIAIPVGIKKKSLAPLVFFGTTGTMVDIIMGISACEREHAEHQMKLLEEQNPTTSAASADALLDES